MDKEKLKQASITSLRMLAASPKSRSQLSKKLADKGFETDVIQYTLQSLESQGILNDRAYALNLVNRLRMGKPCGKRKLAFEMKRKGVPSKLQEEILEGFTEGEDSALAQELAQAKWSAKKNAPALKRKKRVYDFLIRRGFDFQTVRDVVEKISSGIDDENR